MDGTLSTRSEDSNPLTETEWFFFQIDDLTRQQKQQLQIYEATSSCMQPKKYQRHFFLNITKIIHKSSRRKNPNK